MKKIILFLLFPLLSFSQEKTIESFFKEYNYNCENYNGEDLYEFFGFDIEDDVTPALEAINSFCENALKELEKFQEFDLKYVFKLWNHYLAGDPRIQWVKIWSLVTSISL